MEDFEKKLRSLIANKASNIKHPLEPNPKDSLSLLLEHVYEKALLPAYQILIEQDVFSASTIDRDAEFGDAVDDGMEERPMIVITVMQQQQPIFEYWLSFDSDTEASEGKLCRRIYFSRYTCGITDLPANMFDLDTDEWEATRPDKTILDRDKINLIDEYRHFPLDMDKALSLVKDDFYWVCDVLI